MVHIGIGMLPLPWKSVRFCPDVFAVPGIIIVLSLVALGLGDGVFEIQQLHVVTLSDSLVGVLQNVPDAFIRKALMLTNDAMKGGHIVGIVVSKLNAIHIAKATGDIPQNINFAIKDTVAKSFLDSQSVEYETGTTSNTLEFADIGAAAKKFTLLLECLR